MPNPVLTILIPVYNEENTVVDVLNKTTKLRIDNYEIIVVDDASKDKSANLIKKFKYDIRRIWLCHRTCQQTSK